MFMVCLVCFLFDLGLGGLFCVMGLGFLVGGGLGFCLWVGLLIGVAFWWVC